MTRDQLLASEIEALIALLDKADGTPIGQINDLFDRLHAHARKARDLVGDERRNAA